MQYKDEFDGPDRGAAIRSAIGSIFKSLERRERMPERRPVWAAAVVLSLVLFLGSVLWYSYPSEVEKREIMAVPIIRADAGPAKVIPNDPGGMDIPYRDSTVFETLHAGNTKGAGRVENLLPDAEEPISRDELFAGLKTKISVEGREIARTKGADTPKTVDITEPVAVADAKIEQSPAEDDAPMVAVMLPDEEISKELELAAANVPTPVSKPIDAQMSRVEPAAGKQTFEAPANETSSVSGFFVQLASLRSDEAAQTSWKDLQKSLTVLQSLDHRVKRVDLDTRGVFYRLQAGPFEEARARQICAAVEAQRPGGCLVVKD